MVGRCRCVGGISGLTTPTRHWISPALRWNRLHLRRRILQNHLRRSGSSTLRRTLAGLLMAREGYQNRRTDRVVLTDSDETRLTAWMDTHLRLSWSEHPNPRQVEQAIIEKLTPPLNVDHTKGPLRDAVKAARDSYYASAPKP
ncbi:GIY-YIG nuclease family protein [Rhodococcus jostii]|uniref:GIY-YIG nuclease family protein n=1 Tax=Rhodococcus jostii TaxID=132919 RepID=UPI003084096F